LLALAGIGAVSFVLSLLGAAVGMVLGHLRLPLLVAYLGSPVAGAATNLAVSGMGALAGAAHHARDGRVSLRALLLIGLPSAAGAVAGMFLFVKINRFWTHVGLGAVLLFLGVRMLRPGASAASAQAPADRTGAWRLLGEVLIGLLLGALAAATGLMMNGLRLPVLLRLLRGDLQAAVGTNLAIGLLTAVVGVGAAWAAGSSFDGLALAVVGAPTLLGGYLGALWTGRLRKETLRQALGWVIAATGLLMIVQAGWRATRGRDLQPPPHTPAEARQLEDETDEWPDEPDWFDGAADREGDRAKVAHTAP
jgi:uncharacterized membrane protein YfcA